MGMNTNPWGGGFQPKSARKQGIPPGLARRGTLPPGLARRQGVGATGSPSNVDGGAINNATGTSPANSRPVNPAAGTSDRGATGVVPGNGAGEAQPVRAQSKSKAGRRGNAAR